MKTVVNTFSATSRMSKVDWMEKLWRETIKESVIGPYMGKSDNAESLIYVKRRPGKRKGDVIYFGLRRRDRSSVIINGKMEGNETRLRDYSCSVTLRKHRVGIRNESEMDAIRAAYDIDSESLSTIKDRLTEHQDEVAFEAWYDTVSHYLYPDATGAFAKATSDPKALIDATNSKLGANFLGKVKARAKARRDTTGLMPIEPIKVSYPNGGSGKFYVMFVHPDVMADIYEDAAFAQAMREAHVRGPQNPLFSQAQFIYANIIGIESENVEIGTDGGAGSVPYARNILCGKRALCWALGRQMKLVKSDFDYEDEVGYELSVIQGIRKPQFNSKDHGCVQVLTARTQIN